MATIYREGQCLDKRPGVYARKNTYFSQLDSIRETRICPAELVDAETGDRTGNYDRTSRSCPCNHLAFRSYAEMIRCTNKNRGPCDKCA
jgi:hypothetical protein